MRKKITVVAVFAGLILTGCAAEPRSERPSLPSAAATTSPQPDAADAAAVEAESVAVAALSAFVDHDRDQDEWWAEFSQYLSPEARYVWEGVRADRVAASVISGDPIVSVFDATFVSVIVPTDAGSYRLEMAKRVSEGTSDGVWLVFEMVAPASE